MKAARREKKSIDPRCALLVLLLANIIAFTQDCLWLEISWIFVLTALNISCGCVRSGIKLAAGFILLCVVQWYILPISPRLLATSLAIFANYARRMFPCLMMGSLILKTISLREMIVAFRRLHVPQKLIIPISVTLRYFPAIKEEAGHIRDAMRLREIKGVEKIEAMIVPLMISATETAEELSAAAVTRGIENPAPKTSVIELHMRAYDWMIAGAAVVFTIMAFLI